MPKSGRACVRARGIFLPPSPQRPGSPRASFESAPSEGRGASGSERAFSPALTGGLPMIQGRYGGHGCMRDGEIPLLSFMGDRLLGTKFCNFANGEPKF